MTVHRPFVRRNARSALEEIFAIQIEINNLPEPKREFRFDEERRWRFDFSYPEHKIAVECEGATWINGRHTRGSGYEKDLEKYNAAALLGWLVLRFTRAQIQHGVAIVALQKALALRGAALALRGSV